MPNIWERASEEDWAEVKATVKIPSQSNISRIIWSLCPFSNHIIKSCSNENHFNIPFENVVCGAFCYTVTRMLATKAVAILAQLPKQKSDKGVSWNSHMMSRYDGVSPGNLQAWEFYVVENKKNKKKWNSPQMVQLAHPLLRGNPCLLQMCLFKLLRCSNLRSTLV